MRLGWRWAWGGGESEVEVRVGWRWAWGGGESGVEVRVGWRWAWAGQRVRDGVGVWGRGLGFGIWGRGRGRVWSQGLSLGLGLGLKSELGLGPWRRPALYTGRRAVRLLSMGVPCTLYRPWLCLLRAHLRSVVVVELLLGIEGGDGADREHHLARLGLAHPHPHPNQDGERHLVRLGLAPPG